MSRLDEIIARNKKAMVVDDLMLDGLQRVGGTRINRDPDAPAPRPLPRWLTTTAIVVGVGVLIWMLTL
jgi:multisubunit Na+/H+ antiporter MnhC subunit